PTTLFRSIASGHGGRLALGSLEHDARQALPGEKAGIGQLLDSVPRRYLQRRARRVMGLERTRNAGRLALRPVLNLILSRLLSLAPRSSLAQRLLNEAAPASLMCYLDSARVMHALACFAWNQALGRQAQHFAHLGGGDVAGAQDDGAHALLQA